MAYVTLPRRFLRAKEVFFIFMTRKTKIFKTSRIATIKYMLGDSQNFRLNFYLTKVRNEYVPQLLLPDFSVFSITGFPA